MTDQRIAVRLLAAGDEVDESELGGVRDRFMIDGADTDGRFALVQHLFAPKALAAPMHRHRNEDEFTYVLSGRIGAVIEGHEVVANLETCSSNLEGSGTPSGTLASSPPSASS